MTPPPVCPVARAAVLAAALAVAGVQACARQGSPPGGPPDRLAPEVEETRPEPFEVVDDLRDPIRIVFSERISERPTRGTLDDAVLVSPRTGRIRVSHGRNSLEIDLAGGIRPGLVYRVTVLPVIADLFGNPMAAPFELLFSTGGEYTRNAVAGLVLDRITGEPVDAAEVRVHPDWTDTLDLVYQSRTDTAGIYTLRSLPAGRYRVEAFQDLNRDGAPDEFEVRGERQVLLGAADTVLSADVVILAPDTSAAQLARATLEDSMRVGLTFDDYLDPTAPLDEVDVVLEPVPDTTEEGVRMPPPPPPVERILHEREYQAWRDSIVAEREEEDSLVAAALADSAAAAAAGDPAAMAAADTALAAARAAAARRAEGAARVPRPGQVPRPPGQVGRREAEEPATLPDGRPLPSRRLVLVLAEAVPPGTSYLVGISGVVNVNGLGGGGGEARFNRPARPDTAAPDTGAAAVPPDTGAVTVPPDTGAVTVPPGTGAGVQPPCTGRVGGSPDGGAGARPPHAEAVRRQRSAAAEGPPAP